MWKPATRQITGSNDTPLGNRRRFGPVPDDDQRGPVQLAKPDGPVYPRQRQDGAVGEKRGRDDERGEGDKGALKHFDFLTAASDIDGIRPFILTTGLR